MKIEQAIGQWIGLVLLVALVAMFGYAYYPFLLPERLHEPVNMVSLFLLVASIFGAYCMRNK